jgi:EAL domain-containing protein (putative c-di-GMP-specific phosphodiesterase class I)
VIRNPGQVRDLAAQLRQLGLTLSIDEFGQGMTDLGFLRELSVGQLKLAKEAVHAIADGPEGEGSTMARTLIDIGHNLRMPVIGEAVETRAQLDFLTSHGCEALQGLLLSEPILPRRRGIWCGTGCRRDPDAAVVAPAHPTNPRS